MYEMHKIAQIWQAEPASRINSIKLHEKEKEKFIIEKLLQKNYTKKFELYLNNQAIFSLF